MQERIQKLIAAAGLCSRRAAEELLTAGRVTVNGVTAQLGEKADLSQDAVAVNGTPLPGKERPVYLMLHKPRGYVTTLRDEKGRPTVADLTEDVDARVFPVGRLDLQSEGLVLMTNDGELMERLLHPRYEISKTYRLTVAGDVKRAASRLAAVTNLKGKAISPAQVSCLRESGQSALLEVVIHEGKNRQIRRMCSQCGLIVKRLIRIGEHTLTLGDLPAGKWRFLTDAEIAKLRQ